MPAALIKTTAAILVFGGLAFAAEANAIPALTLGETSLVVPVVDQEDLAVEEDLRPNEPPEALMGEEPEKKMMMDPMPKESESESGSGANIEDEMIDEIGPGAE